MCILCGFLFWRRFCYSFFWSTIDFLTSLKVPGIQSLHVLSQPLNSALVEDLTGLRKEKTHNYTVFLLTVKVLETHIFLLDLNYCFYVPTNITLFLL